MVEEQPVYADAEKKNGVTKSSKNGDFEKDRKLFIKRAFIVITIILCIGLAEFILFVYGQFTDIAFQPEPELNTFRQLDPNGSGNETAVVSIEYYTIELELKIENRGRIPTDAVVIDSYLEVTNRSGFYEKIRATDTPEIKELEVLERITFNLTFKDVPLDYDLVIEFYLEAKEEGEVTEKINTTLKTDQVFKFRTDIVFNSKDLMKRNSNIFVIAVVFEGMLVLATIILGMVFLNDKLLALSVSALGLAPLFRIINVATPAAVDFLVFVTMSYGFLLVAVFIFVYVNKISWKKIGASFNKIHIFLPLAIFIGFLLAPIEYVILGPPPWIPVPSVFNILVLTLVMILFVGLAEELMFRAIIQTNLEKLLSPRIGLFLTALLFGLMHGVWTSYRELLFTFAAGLLFGYIYQKTRNLPFIAVLHGVEDVFLFGVLPFLLPASDYVL